MSLEAIIAANTAALEANTAAILATKGTASADKTAAAGKEKTAAAGKEKTAKPKSEFTREDMVAVIQSVSEKFGKEGARALFLKDGVTKMAEIADADIDSVYKAGKAKLAEEVEADDDI